MDRTATETLTAGPIYLIGYMGAGKSTVGKLLAERLGWHFIDLDDAFTEIHGLSPAEYIRQYGIDDFRVKEKYVVEDVADWAPTEHIVYATGGGYPCWEDNMECLHELGQSIYIRWSAHDLASRLLLTDLTERPILQGRSFEELLAFIEPQLLAREPFYYQADYVIQAPGFFENADSQIAEEICQLMKFKTR